MVQIIPVVLITLFLLFFTLTCIKIYVRIQRKAELARLDRINQERASQTYYTLRHYNLNNLERATPVVRAETNVDPSLPSYIPHADRTQELPRLYEMIRRLEAEPDTMENRSMLQDLRNEVERQKGHGSARTWAHGNNASQGNTLAYHEATSLPTAPPPTYSVTAQNANLPHT